MYVFPEDWATMGGPGSAKSGQNGQSDSTDGKNVIYDEMVEELCDPDGSDRVRFIHLTNSVHSPVNVLTVHSLQIVCAQLEYWKQIVLVCCVLHHCLVLGPISLFACFCRNASTPTTALSRSRTQTAPRPSARCGSEHLTTRLI